VDGGITVSSQHSAKESHRKREERKSKRISRESTQIARNQKNSPQRTQRNGFIILKISRPSFLCALCDLCGKFFHSFAFFAVKTFWLSTECDLCGEILWLIANC
jgi:hypothetical protein